MSHLQGPHKTFFQFGNPFRKITTPKSSHFSSKLLSVLNTFEQTLADRLSRLIPKDKDAVLSLPWMKLAIESLCETHSDIKVLIAELDLPVSEWDGKWVDVYLDITVKLLDLCIAFSSEMARLNQGHILLQCALHNLKSTLPQQFLRSSSSLDGWRQHANSKNPRIQSCCSILEGLVGSLDLPKVKNSAKGKILMRALYGVKVETLFLCSVFAAAFSGSPKKLLDLSVADGYLWAQAFTDLQTNANGELRNIFSSKGVTVLKEVEEVDVAIKNLYPVMQEKPDSAKVEEFENLTADLGGKADKLRVGLDLLSKEVDAFFQIILAARNALLGNLRGSDANLMPKKVQNL